MPGTVEPRATATRGFVQGGGGSQEKMLPATGGPARSGTPSWAVIFLGPELMSLCVEPSVEAEQCLSERLGVIDRGEVTDAVEGGLADVPATWAMVS